MTRLPLRPLTMSALIALVCVSSGCEDASTSTTADEVIALKQQVASLSDKVKSLSAEVATAKATISQYQAALEEFDRSKPAEMRDRLSMLADTVQNHTQALEQVKSQFSRNQAELKAQADLFTQKAMLASAISSEALEKGYVLPFDGDEHLLLKPVGDGVLKLGSPAGVATGRGYLQSAGPATMLTVPWIARGEMTMAAFIKPANLSMNGPARIVSISRDTGSRNFTLGQEGTRLVVRCRTTKAGDNGTDPALTTGEDTLTGKPQAIMFVRRGEKNLLFVDGTLAASEIVPGDLTNWDYSMPLILGNELTGDRAWTGDLYKVVFYNRALTDEEVQATSDELKASLPKPTPPAPAE